MEKKLKTTGLYIHGHAENFKPTLYHLEIGILVIGAGPQQPTIRIAETNERIRP